VTGADARGRPAFADRLDALVRARRSSLVLGLDPDPRNLWPDAAAAVAATRGDGPHAGNDAGAAGPAASAAAAVAAHCCAVIDAAGEACVAAKLQLACFERLGGPGWEALGTAAAHARAAGLLVIADGKRGDVPVTAAAYAQALVGSTPTPFGDVDGLGVDAFTLNPLLGRDALAPLLDAAAAAGAGVFVLVRTSNAGAEELQEARLDGGGTLSDRLADLVSELGEAQVGRSGLSDVGAVVGATAGPEALARLRRRMPRSVLLLPGVGAQGGRIDDIAPAFEPGPAGGLVAASRAIVDAHRASAMAPAAAAAEAAERLRETAWTLAQAV
jgi:orotidine-5'-phosphate decarboxylase